MKIKDLRNHFLIAMPSINDPIFRKSLILICDDNSDGTMGLIINKPIDDSLMNNIILDTNIENDFPKNSKIYLGGPVNLDVGFVIHESNYKTEQTLSISNELSITSDKKIVSDIKKNSGPNNFIFTLGYAGWGKQQLQNEIKNGDWLITPADSKYIFKNTDKDKWDIYSSIIGISHNDLSGQIGKA